MSEQAAIDSLLNAIATAYQDPEIKNDPELSKLLVKSSKQLQKTGKVHQVAASLNQGLQFWGMGHLHGPKALDALYQATITDTHGRAYQKLPTGFHD